LELEHLKIETRLINERFTNVMGECENVVYYEEKKKNPCPREGMFRGSFARARGRDEG
jgi:hypothetical protein